MLEGRIFDGGRAGDLFRGTLASATQAAAVIGRLQKAKVRHTLCPSVGSLWGCRLVVDAWLAYLHAQGFSLQSSRKSDAIPSLPTPSYRSLQGASCACGQTGTKWMQSKQNTQSRQPQQSTGEPRKRQTGPAADVGGLTRDMQCSLKWACVLHTLSSQQPNGNIKWAWPERINEGDGQGRTRCVA